MILLKMGVENKEVDSTVQFTHRRLGTGLKAEWENHPSRRVFHWGNGTLAQEWTAGHWGFHWPRVVSNTSCTFEALSALNT